MANVPAFVQPLYQYPVGQSPFWNIDKAGGPGNAYFEGGIDIPNPNHTPVYALADGELLSAHLFWHNPPSVQDNLGGAPGYGVVSQRVSVPGFGLNDIYYQHIDIAPGLPTCLGGACNNVLLKKGQLIGWTRAPDPGEIEIGVNPQNWGPVWGPANHPGPWVNPETRIRALVDSDPNFNWGQTVGGAATGPGQQIANLLQQVQLAPDASVAQFFTDLDAALELRNPFTVQIDTSVTDITVFGIDTGLTNPVSDSRAVFEGAQEIFYNIMQDMSALIVRGAFILVGLFILWAILQNIVFQAGQGLLDKVGGAQGVVELAGAFA